MLSMDVKGLRELDQLLNTLPVKMQKRILNSAVRQGANVVAKAARESAPIASEPYTTHVKGKAVTKFPGSLRRNIRALRARSKDTAVVNHVGPVRKGKNPIDDVFYWKFLEFGTKYIPARPFLRPAFYNNINAVIERVRVAIDKGLKREFKKLARSR